MKQMWIKKKNSDDRQYVNVKYLLKICYQLSEQKDKSYTSI